MTIATTSPLRRHSAPRMGRQNAQESETCAAIDGPKEGELSTVEQALVDGLRKSYAERSNIRLKIGEGNTIEPDHGDLIVGYGFVCSALGNVEIEFAEGILKQIANAVSVGSKPDIHRINFAFSFVKSIKPRDEVEALLAVQMVSVHMLSMMFSRRLAHVENIQQQDSAERALNKLIRTYTAQMEALRKYRTGGQQKMIVEHVTVNNGGQAIVGNVSPAGGGS